MARKKAEKYAEGQPRPADPIAHVYGTDGEKGEMRASVGKRSKKENVEKVEKKESGEKKPGHVTAAGFVRTGVMIHEDVMEQIRNCAYWERMSFKEVVHEALTRYLKTKDTRPRPRKK